MQKTLFILTFCFTSFSLSAANSTEVALFEGSKVKGLSRDKARDKWPNEKLVYHPERRWICLKDDERTAEERHKDERDLYQTSKRNVKRCVVRKSKDSVTSKIGEAAQLLVKATNVAFSLVAGAVRSQISGEDYYNNEQRNKGNE